MNEIPRPDLSNRPLSLTCEHIINASPDQVFAAWSDKFDSWFAQPGTLSLTAQPGQAYFFYNRDDWGRHPHYGRFLDVKPNARIEMTWITGNGTDVGTQGAETVLLIELTHSDDATHLRLTHSGFISEQSRDGHAENWPLALEILDEVLRG